MITEYLLKAIESGEELNIIYHSGSKHEEMRKIIPRSIDGDTLKAVDTKYNRVKSFSIKKIEILDKNNEQLKFEDDNLQKDSILFKEISFFVAVLTVSSYVSSYACEVMTASYFGFDVDLISLSMSVIVKNSVILLSIITITLIPFILVTMLGNKNYYKKKASKLEKIASFLEKNNKWRHIIFIIYLTIILICSYYFLSVYLAKDNFYILLLACVITAFCYSFYRMIYSNKPMHLLYSLAIFLFLCIVLAILVFMIFPLKNFKPYQSFEYNGQSYILLRNYDGNLVANKIIIKQPVETIKQEESKLSTERKQPDKYCFNKEILYLPKDSIKEGLTFKKVDVEGYCDGKTNNDNTQTK